MKNVTIKTIKFLANLLIYFITIECNLLQFELNSLHYYHAKKQLSATLFFLMD